MHVTLVIGLPASGKSTWAEGELRRLAQTGVFARLVDDPREPDEIALAVEQALMAGVTRLFITDPNLCSEKCLVAAEVWLHEQGLTVTRVYFRNDAEQCLKNACLPGRVDKTVSMAIRMWSRHYTPPDDALDVYRPA